MKEKLKSLIKKIKSFDTKILFNSRWYIMIIGVVLMLKTILFYSDTVFFSEDIWLWTLRQTLFFVIIFLSPLLLIKKSKNRFILSIIMNLFVSIVLFADELYYEYSSNIISVMQAGNLQYKDEILVAIPTLLKLRQILYFIDFPAMIYLLIRKKIPITDRKNFEWKPVIAMVIGIIILCTHYKFVPESMELVTGYIYNKNKSVRFGTIYGYHAVDLLNALTNGQTVAYKNFDEMIVEYNKLKDYQNQNNPDNMSYRGIAKDMNLISIQLESIQNFVIGASINGKEITPNINKFFAENIQVSNLHASSYTTTADSEHSFITSMYPTENGEAFSKYYSNTYDDIFNNMKEAGYTNIYAHGNHPYFWNRENVTSKYPIDKRYFLEDFEDQSELIRTYLSDELLYKQIMDGLDLSNGKVFVDMIAASSHKPFELAGIVDKESKVNIDIGKYAGTDLGNYLEACNYADYAFGIFLDKLKEKGMYDNTVVVVFGDHYGMTMYDENLIEFLGEDKLNYNDSRMQFEFTNVACGIRVPGIEGVKIEQATSKIDLKSTILQLFDIEEEISLGKSIFDGKPYTCINNGKIVSDDYWYDGSDWSKLSTGEKIDLESLDEIEKNKLKEIEEMAIREIGISNSIVVENLLKDYKTKLLEFNTKKVEAESSVENATENTVENTVENIENNAEIVNEEI